MTLAKQSLPGVWQTGTHAARPAASAVANGALYACSTHFIIYQSDGTTWSNWLVLPVAQNVGATLVVGDGINVIAVGAKGYVEVPFAGTITAARVMSADASVSIVFDVKKATYAGLPTLSSITASAKPTLASAQKSEDTTLTGWTTAIAAGDWLEISVVSATAAKLVTLSLTIARS
jgi:hypothetical protein